MIDIHDRRRNQSRRGIRLMLIVSVGFLLTLIGPRMAQSQDSHQHHNHPASPSKEESRESSAGSVMAPDIVLLNQNGERVHVYGDLIKGKVVAINTIFTTCTTICPPMGATFSKLRELIGGRIGEDVNLISISVDPVTDTPQRLKAWGEKFHAGPGWTLLTGPKHEVDRLLKALKVFSADKWDHAPIVLIGSEASGEWTRAYGLAPPSKLAEIIAGVIGDKEADRK